MCKEPVWGDFNAEEEALIQTFDTTPIVRARGCPSCGGTGYSGRLPVAEVMPMSPGIEKLISAGAETAELREAALLGGTRMFGDGAREVAEEGKTTLGEVARVLGVGRREETAEEEQEVLPRILVVDDETATRTLVRKILERHSFEVQEASGGLGALEIIAEQKDFDLIVLDLLMPDMKGEDVLKELRRNLGTAGIPIVILTMLAQRDAELRLLGNGADDYVRKPVDPVQFAARIEAVLHRTGGRLPPKDPKP